MWEEYKQPRMKGIDDKTLWTSSRLSKILNSLSGRCESTLLYISSNTQLSDSTTIKENNRLGFQKNFRKFSTQFLLMALLKIRGLASKVIYISSECSIIVKHWELDIKKQFNGIVWIVSPHVSGLFRMQWKLPFWFNRLFYNLCYNKTCFNLSHMVLSLLKDRKHTLKVGLEMVKRECISKN